MEYALHLICLVLIFSLATLAQSLLVGYTGVVFVAAAGFMGIGAYVAALVLEKSSMALPVALIVAALVCAVCGCLTCVLLRKLKQDYLALATMGVGLILNDVFNNWHWFTNGPVGKAVPAAVITPLHNALALAIVLSIATIAVLLISRSSYGSLLRAIKDDEELVHSIGCFTLWPKVGSFGMSFFLLGLAGAWLGYYLTYIDPSSFRLSDSIAILSMTIVAGAQSPVGAVLGAGVFVLLPEGFRFLGLSPDVASQIRQALFGAMLVALMIWRPQGLLGKYQVQ
jgi:branched-chain amino acid transport system permease protein